ncbi:hypothetical protein O0L34_g9302 [Tuta absoluta]|nr:hypothetical protein O0L34_g9302 [Tuta absoluta]
MLLRFEAVNVSLQNSASCRTYNVAACVFRRPWLSMPFGMWVVVSIAYYWWLIAHMSVPETQNRMYQHKLKQGQSGVNMRQMPIDSSRFKGSEMQDSAGTLCETIHLSLMCMGKCGHNITPMLKSLLHHRQNPLHFHLIVDTKTEKVIRTLFKTWSLPDVKCSLYNAEGLLSKLLWIPNSHYSGVYLFVKLLYPDILPKRMEQVIVLDTDLTFLSDVVELWSMFRNMTHDQLIGLVENESDWYLQTSRWPALGRGYNTGVMLLNLRHIRERVNWTRLWNDAVRENIKKLDKTELGDQDIINAIVKKYPHIIYNVSCQYNVQMSTQTLAKSCYGGDRDKVKILHWNSPSKHNIGISDANFFRSVHVGFVGLDGNLLREKLHRCWPTEQLNITGPNSDMCTSFRAASRVKLRTHLYYTEYLHHRHDNFDVTVVVQLSMDRLQFFERLVRYWEGPVSAAIYLADCEVSRLESFIREQATLSSRSNIAYHLVFKHDAMHYPVNYLRNVALEHCTTPYVFLMDADFVPMHGLYEHLRHALQAINPYPQKKCLVVAAFESQRYRASPPRNKLQLVARLGGGKGGAREGRFYPFRAHEWPRGHRATNYTRWVTATKPYEVEWEAGYEPYLVCHRSIPKYDTRFSGFGWNKVSHIVELRARGYRAVVLPDAFVVHTTHAPSADITAFRANPHYRVCLALLKQEFLEDLGRKHNVTFEEFKQEQIDGSDKDKIIFYHKAKEPT